MRNRAFLAVLISALALGATAVRAEVGASGTRLSVAGGPARFYMTYGHAEEPELYAPIIPELARFQVTFQRRGEDYAVFYKGTEKAVWPIVRSRDDVPETGEEPCVLVMGGNVFVPVRKLSELFPIEVKWDKGDNLLALVPGSERRTPAVAGPQKSGPQTPRVAEAPPVLTGVELVQGPQGVQLRVKSTAPVSPRLFYLKPGGGAPARIVLDFDGAKWADGIQAPPGLGDVQKVRTGYFRGTVPPAPRIALEVPSPAYRLARLEVRQDEILASVGQGKQGPIVIDEGVIAALKTRQQLITQTRSRGGLILDGNNVRGSELPGIPGLPERGPIQLRPGSLAGKVICVDAGHGGYSTGAHGLNNLEKELTLKMAREFQAALEARGAQVIMTRADDTYVSLEGRCEIANRSNADIFVSIHLNSTPRRNSASGTEAYWFNNPESLRLAQMLHPRVCQCAQREDRRIRGDRGFFVIKYTRMPSVLLEIAYINNENDEQLLANPAFQNRLGEHLAQGVVDYFDNRQASSAQ